MPKQNGDRLIGDRQRVIEKLRKTPKLGGERTVRLWVGVRERKMQRESAHDRYGGNGYEKLR